MHIGVDARELVGRPTGVGRYVAQLLARWTARSGTPAHRFTLFSHGSIPGTRSLPAVSHVTIAGAGGTRWEQLSLPGAVRAAGCDVLFAPAYTSPIFAPVPVVLTVHDVSFAAHPEWFRPRERWRRRLITSAAARRARAVLTVSEFSKAEIVRLLGVPAERVRVVLHGVGLEDDATPAVARPAANVDGDGPLLLFVGSIFNRRHLPALIESLALVRARHAGARLSVVGDNRTWPPQDLRAVAADAGVADAFDDAAFVDDARLRSLYASAAVFVFLSEYEGFGLTPLEALAHGVPIVVLDTPVAREIYGPAAEYVAAPDARLVADAVGRVLEDPDLRAVRLSESAAVLARYRWSTAAAETLAAIEDAIRA